MSNLPLIPSRWTVSAQSFEQISELLQHTASVQAEEFCVVTEQMVMAVGGLAEGRRSTLSQSRFTLVASNLFSGLLVGYQHIQSHLHSVLPASQESPGDDRPAQHTKGTQIPPKSRTQPPADPPLSDVLPVRYAINLTFEPRAIAAFIRELATDLPIDHPLQNTLRLALTLLQTNSPRLQTDFTLDLVQCLSQPAFVEEQLSHHRQTDITHSVETQLAQRTQILHDAMLAAQSADQAKSEFLAAMSHELRTPLTYILGMSATLLRWSNPDNSTPQDQSIHQQQHIYLQNIHRQGEHLLELINDILDLSQLESGKVVLDLQEFSLSLLVQQTLKVYIDKAREKKIRLELDMHIAPELDRFTADPRRIRQIILNLLSNAVKFTGPNGSITFRVSTSKDAVILQVKDTGIGIPEHLQSDIFQKFRQLDGSYRREYEGTGLGLALTKQLVDLHGGRIECQSTVNVGTVFTVKLPRHPFTHHSPDESSCMQASYRPLGRVVLIENQDESAHFVSDMLMAAGYQLIWMLEGLTAVNQIEVLQPSMVIVGTHLSDTDSREIIAQLRLNPLTKHLKIIALGTNQSLHEKSTYEDVGVDDFWVYPMRPEELLHRIGLAIATS